MVLGEDRDAVGLVIDLAGRIAGMRGVYAGRLRNAAQVESLTANLIAINRRYKHARRAAGDEPARRLSGCRLSPRHPARSAPPPGCRSGSAARPADRPRRPPPGRR